MLPKIYILVDQPFETGIGKFALELCRALTKRKQPCTILYNGYSHLKINNREVEILDIGKKLPNEKFLIFVPFY